MARATSSLPVPLSLPESRMLDRLGAAWMIQVEHLAHLRAAADDVAGTCDTRGCLDCFCRRFRFSLYQAAPVPQSHCGSRTSTFVAFCGTALVMW